MPNLTVPTATGTPRAAHPPASRPVMPLAWPLACALSLGAALWPAPPATVAPSDAPTRNRHTPVQRVAADLLAGLREAAALGNVQASVSLVDALLARHAVSGAAADLIEALQWVERDLDLAPMLGSRALQHLLRDTCVHEAALQRHWLCNAGE